MDLNNLLTSHQKLTEEDLRHIATTRDYKEYMVLNHIEEKLKQKMSKETIKRTVPKIQYIAGLLLHSNYADLYDMYSFTYDVHMKNTNNNYDEINSFNIFFVNMVHVAAEILRKKSKKVSE